MELGNLGVWEARRNSKVAAMLSLSGAPTTLRGGDRNSTESAPHSQISNILANKSPDAPVGFLSLLRTLH